MRQSRGFTLVEIVVVLLIFAIVVAMGAVIARAVMAGQKRSITTTRMAAIDAALAQYASLQRRLPCPADGRKNTETAADAGTQMTPAVATDGCGYLEQRYGVVPWRDLGLSEEDATDGWGRRFTYRVFPILTAPDGIDMSGCDPAGGVGVSAVCGTGIASCCATCTAATFSSCTRPLDLLKQRRGIEVQDMNGTPVMNPNPVTDPPTGAAYLVISHGETGGGGYNRYGSLYTSTTNGNDSAREQLNYADRLVVLPPDPTYTDDLINDSLAAHFDDIVSHPSVSAVVNKAGLGPRAH